MSINPKYKVLSLTGNYKTTVELRQYHDTWSVAEIDEYGNTFEKFKNNYNLARNLYIEKCARIHSQRSKK